MKILSLGLDNSILNKDSRLAKRVLAYETLVDRYIVVVPSAKKERLVLSDKTEIFGAGGVNRLVKFFQIYNISKKILRAEKPDVITVQDQYYLAILAWRLAVKFKVGLEIQIHGFEKYFGLRKLLAKFVIPRASSIRVVSQRLKKEIINNFGVNEDKIVVAPIYVEVPAYAKASAGRESQNEKFIFLTVGRLVPVKNITLQIKAMAEVIKKHSEAKLWIAGEGSERKKLEKMVDFLNLGNGVKFFGWQNDLRDFYAQADAFVLTSNYEGWGLAVVEAASAGLPIIMTKVGCAEEVIKDKASGLIIGVKDDVGLVEAMLKIIEDSDLSKRLGAGARKAVEKLPSQEEVLELYRLSWEKAIYK